MTARPLSWIAARDGIAHASRGRDPRALCGVPSIDQRFAWPTRFHCLDCVRILAAGDQPTLALEAQRPEATSW